MRKNGEGRIMGYYNINLASKLGLKEAIFIEKLDFMNQRANYVGKDIDGERWAYRTIKEWQKLIPELGSEISIRRMISRLVKEKIIRRKIKKYGFITSFYYALNYDNVVLKSAGYAAIKMIAHSDQNDHTQRSKRSSCNDHFDRSSTEKKEKNSEKKAEAARPPFSYNKKDKIKKNKFLMWWKEKPGPYREAVDDYIVREIDYYGPNNPKGYAQQIKNEIYLSDIGLGGDTKFNYSPIDDDENLKLLIQMAERKQNAIDFKR